MRFGAGADMIGPEYRPDLLTQAGDPTLSDVPYGPEYNPVLLFLDTHKWWLIGGGAVFLLAGGSILGLSITKKKFSGRRRRR